MQASGETEELFGGRNNMKEELEQLISEYTVSLNKLKQGQHYYSDHEWDIDQGRICILEDVIGDLRGILNNLK